MDISAPALQSNQVMLILNENKTCSIHFQLEILEELEFQFLL